MNLGLTGKRFVIGGGGKGLGRAVAQALADEGARVLLVSRSQESVDRAAAELGDNALALAADLSTPDGVDTVISHAAIALGSVDGVLVNAGGPPPGDVLDLTDEQWRESFEILVGGPVRLLRGLVPQMTAGGAILFLTSSSVRQPIPGLDASNVLRPGVAAMVKCLARELAPSIRVNSLAPGRFDTDRVRMLDGKRADAAGITLEEQREQTAKTIPLGRYGDPAELGRVGAFLLSPAASYVTGSAVQIDGGYVTSVP